MSLPMPQRPPALHVEAIKVAEVVEIVLLRHVRQHAAALQRAAHVLRLLAREASTAGDEVGNKLAALEDIVVPGREGR